MFHKEAKFGFIGKLESIIYKTMTKPIKLFLILLVIILFSNGILNSLIIFSGYCSNLKYYFLMALTSFALSYVINEEIIINDEKRNDS